MTKADKILHFFAEVNFSGELPPGIGIMNPYQESEYIRSLCYQFYHKYYNDENPRILILGINPGRLGAGATGIPFTDTKRLNEQCGISNTGFITHEPSSVYVCEMIAAYGGPEEFYKKFYINSVCPLGFIKKEMKKVINYNYYDSKSLIESVEAFIIQNIQLQIDIAGNSDLCYCLGTGKNFHFLNKLNIQHKFFKRIIPLEHPRYIMQYRNKEKENYIADYLEKLGLNK